MHAAEANPPDDPGGRHPTVTPWPEANLVALPSPTGSALHWAMVFSRQQQEMLARLADALAHLAHLADQSRQSDTSDSERQGLNCHFHERAAGLKGFVEVALDNQPLFHRQDWTVDLSPHGNKLVIPGIYRGPEQSHSLRQADLLSARSAAATHQRILEILEWLSIDQALVSEIRSRLNFAAHLSQRADLVGP